MDLRLSERQSDVRAALSELFNEDLDPATRRMGARALGAGPAAMRPDGEDGATRRIVWDALAELGALRLAVPPYQAGLVLAAELMGAALYTSPYPDTVTAAAVLAATGNHSELLARIAAGAVMFAVAPRAQGTDDPATPAALTIDGRHISGRRRFVAFAADVDYLLVPGLTPDGSVLALVRRDQPGVTIRRHDDIARGDLYAVIFDRADVAADGWLGGADPPGVWRAALGGARLRHAAYLVGLCRAALVLTVAYAKQRQQFGQPIARHQSLAFRLAALHGRIEVARELVNRGAWECDTAADTAEMTANQALAMAGGLAREVTAEGIQVHGAHGMTERTDIQLYYRRAAVDAVWLGTPTQCWLAAAAELSAGRSGDGGQR